MIVTFPVLFLNCYVGHREGTFFFLCQIIRARKSVVRVLTTASGHLCFLCLHSSVIPCLSRINHFPKVPCPVCWAVFGSIVSVPLLLRCIHTRKVLNFAFCGLDQNSTCAFRFGVLLSHIAIFAGFQDLTTNPHVSQDRSLIWQMIWGGMKYGK